jgi:hypothetical protein
MLTSKIEKIQSQHIERKAVIYIPGLTQFSI